MAAKEKGNQFSCAHVRLLPVLTYDPGALLTLKPNKVFFFFFFCGQQGKKALAHRYVLFSSYNEYNNCGLEN